MIERIGIFLCIVALGTSTAFAIERFPPPQFESDYVKPQVILPQGRPITWEYIDLFVLVIALSMASWIVHKNRSRMGIFLLMLACLAYLGFFKKGCICPVGSIQNVTLTIFNTSYFIPTWVILVFVIPLVFSLFYGRVFCGAVCPLGAIQDLLTIKPISIPAWLDSILRIGGYIYLLVAVLATAVSGVFLVCNYDPFVAAFRFSGNLPILIVGACVLLIGVFVARPYCRFLCPYGVLLRNLSRLSRKTVTISPDVCVSCGLCQDACPFGAIKGPVGPLRPEIFGRIKARFLIWLAATVLLMVGGLLLGRLGSSGLARLDTKVRMAVAYQRGIPATQDLSYIQEAVAVYLSEGGSPERLAQAASEQMAKYRFAGAGLGALIGLLIGIKVLVAFTSRPVNQYYADPALCLACGRCFVYCPREHLRRGDIRPATRQ